MFDHGLQVSTQFDGQIFVGLLRLFELCLHGGVGRFGFFGGRCVFQECECGLLLRGFEGVEPVGQSCERLRHSRSRKLHFLEHGRDVLQRACVFERADELQERGVGVGLDEFGEFLHVESGGLCHLGGSAINCRQYVLHGGGALLDAYHALIQNGCNRSNIRLCHIGRVPDTGQTCGEFQKIGFCCR